MSKKAKQSREYPGRNDESLNRKSCNGCYEDDAISLSKLSYEFEWRRYESLLNASGRMIAGLSLVVVALVTATPVLLEIPGMLRGAAVAELVIAAIILIASLIMAVLMQFRYKYTGVHSPETIDVWLQSALDALEEEQKNESSSRRDIISSLKLPHSSLDSLNFKLAKFMDASVVLLLVAVGFIAVSILFDVGAYFVLSIG